MINKIIVLLTLYTIYFVTNFLYKENGLSFAMNSNKSVKPPINKNDVISNRRLTDANAAEMMQKKKSALLRTHRKTLIDKIKFKKKGKEDVQKEVKKVEEEVDKHVQGGYYMGDDDLFSSNMDESLYSGKNNRNNDNDDAINEMNAASPHDNKWLDEITVLVKTFNRYKPSTELIISVNKSYPTLKVIVADDGILNQERYYRRLGNRIKYYKLKYDQGLSHGRNYLVKKAKTKYVLILDDDFQFTNKTNLYALYQQHITFDADIVSGKLDDRQ